MPSHDIREGKKPKVTNPKRTKQLPPAPLSFVILAAAQACSMRKHRCIFGKQSGLLRMLRANPLVKSCRTMNQHQIFLNLATYVPPLVMIFVQLCFPGSHPSRC